MSGMTDDAPQRDPGGSMEGGRAEEGDGGGETSAAWRSFRGSLSATTRARVEGSPTSRRRLAFAKSLLLDRCNGSDGGSWGDGLDPDGGGGDFFAAGGRKSSRGGCLRSTCAAVGRGAAANGVSGPPT